MLITNSENFLDAVRRIAAMNEGIVFDNCDESFEIMFRHNPECPTMDAMMFDALILYDEDNDTTGRFRKLLQREVFETEDDEYILARFYIEHAATSTSESVKAAMEKLNAFHSIRVCPCNNYFIRDGKPMCFFCHMTSTAEALECAMCSICHEETPRITLHTQTCCGQIMHMHCLDKWHKSDASGENPSCPMCRSVLKIFSS